MLIRYLIIVNETVVGLAKDLMNANVIARASGGYVKAIVMVKEKQP